MNNELRDKVIEIITDVYDRQAQICDSADEIIALVEAVLAQQQEAEPDGYVYEFVSLSGAPVWRHDSGKWNGQRPKSSRPYFFHPPKPAAQPQVPEGYQLVPVEMEAALVGKIVDAVFDGALEDWTVITDIWDAALSAAKEEGE